MTDAESTGAPDYIRTVEKMLVDGCGDCEDLPAGYADAPTLPGGMYVGIECVASRSVGDFQDGPVLAVYGDAVEYIDQSEIADTGGEFLRAG